MSSNVYQFCTQVVCDLLNGNIGTLQAHNDTLKMYVDTNQALTTSWTVAPKADPDYKHVKPGEPGYDPTQELLLQLDHCGSPDSFQNFISTYLKGDNLKDSLHLLSSGLCILIMTKLSTDCWSTKSDSPSASQMNVVNQISSLVSSTGQNEEQSGQNESKTESGVVQTDGSIQQSVADGGNTINGVGGNLAGLLQQSY